MKKIYSFLAGIAAIILVLWGIATHLDSKINSRDSQKLVIYNWGDYIDPELLTQFTEETGIQVQYETFDSNEAMYTKIKQGGTTYDIAIPSEYMINKMKDEDLLVPLDYSKIEGIENIGPEFLNQSFDPGNKFSIPYFWPTFMIVNQTVILSHLKDGLDRQYLTTESIYWVIGTFIFGNILVAVFSNMKIWDKKKNGSKKKYILKK